ncbi:MAG: Nif3-like dinuclear metal center hexameric protein [Pseudomonadales bacterium]|jgi:dinuclear metal center YbgI/SA1388 family protein|uniref:Nif3-like dinuclear metal center hexameric protein n=1 Tax=unclassified Ketobacter TaxID=2639109 RepID=UPI000C6AF424|nr:MULTISPECIES: Nif3-like dinuclear metal center hexameric protein [unclassified Ketobacter]MAQ25381.1 Nif3-like dinuclear metal center hexameric protein [Pseudomonadales bacterium]MEC8811095.1 Nif3-like dinuclear metal center hexameric protein [Pseudomonadota bacterium]TNC88601.1 MAG: Nif3-like dinuclear metal center hexameric protein [Alcanivorax sp.]HAG95727.1 Nif3-like dinuclear metal center hexameric protein [Gammaproteobacteria bacterium]MBI25901.1 Nif3-like dinuclear metal center hexam|tara:strand:+ start:20682 stop:21440 length:759 start_codon:yes stop_codon:yes gene_type:complete
MIERQALLQYLNSLLEPEYFKDYAPNGLQVQGKVQIKTLVTGVTATQALIERAVELDADALFVHHGYFWRGEDPSIVGMKYNRIKCLLEHQINLFAYHLPLDAHTELGNNAQLAQRLGLLVEGGLDPLEKRPIGNWGCLRQPRSAEAFAATIESALGRPPLLVKGGDHPVLRVAWCTGGAQGYIEKAVAMGVDAFISGEISEPTTHIARECGIHYYAAGHHATERYGAQAVGEHLAAKFKLNHEFVDIDNPA